MHFRFYSFVAILLIFNACNKDSESKDSCANGFLDPGEQGIDCGGSCIPCVANEPEYLYMECNGVPVNFPNKDLQEINNDWVLTASNDTFSIQINFGTDTTIGIHPLLGPGNLINYQSVLYSNMTGGSYGIFYNDPVTKKMGGFFQAKYWRTGFDDTLWIQNGQFEYMKY